MGRELVGHLRRINVSGATAVGRWIDTRMERGDSDLRVRLSRRFYWETYVLVSID